MIMIVWGTSLTKKMKLTPYFTSTPTGNMRLKKSNEAFLPKAVFSSVGSAKRTFAIEIFASTIKHVAIRSRTIAVSVPPLTGKKGTPAFQVTAAGSSLKVRGSIFAVKRRKRHATLYAAKNVLSFVLWVVAMLAASVASHRNLVLGATATISDQHTYVKERL